jgi:hypothetical protein
MVFSDGYREFGEASEYASIPRNQFSLAVLDMCERSETVEL